MSNSGGGFLSKLKALDAYPKINEDFFTKTMSGGIITIVASVVMVLLFLSELRLYMTTQSVHELSVDVGRGEKIQIHFDLTFPKVPCSWLSLDAMDISGELHLDLDHDVYKQRLSANGSPVKEVEKHNVEATKKVVPVNGTENSTATPVCGSCYGAEDRQGDCCNTCDEVRAAYRRKGWALANVDHIEQCAHDLYTESIKEQTGEGCHMWGMLEVNKVAGNFHFAPGRSYQQGSMHVHDIAPFGDAVIDFRHTVNKLSFGAPYPGMKNPLDNAKAGYKSAAATGMYQYFLKVVPTSYTGIDNKTLATNQFSVTENFRESSQGGAGKTLPGVFFFYDLSPIKVRIVEHSSSFLSFLTSVCAIVGGVFTVSGIVDAFIYTSTRLIRKKMELGKFS
ncbi:hypothetical protein VOLCADRAFT_80399 [Volvox carteri f. nagariensis]|uniref:Uncharacterized protein n=1 Tax=Volvox carteri f. nagariensis TaxID=3068 RepID=D8TR25_VOLCA|nr:uncharacterized protein VOLCADRAFT_80399 [Volvox carteri f. nagariensis]EFJ50127.1 hypothetical protein VOLCADRAFT_80399 [Volvox carteri f. nagariensis]|eukprot:XP_002948747.1 hypothetical protein VOLCADRAFT_80399 [Volvox carteri f. nagariensis]